MHSPRKFELLYTATTGRSKEQIHCHPGHPGESQRPNFGTTPKMIRD
jgi:hypothetical protein